MASRRGTKRTRARSPSPVEEEDILLRAQRTPKATLEDFAGLDELKERIVQFVVRPFAYPTQASILRRKCPRGVLFTGRPGTGKTMLADAIVSEIRRLGRQVNYFEETGQCLCKYVGESERNLRELFQRAHEEGPTVIFLDEIDGLARKREATTTSAATSIMSTLLTEISRIERGKVLLIAATNCENLVDQAVIRKGRFDITFQIPLPKTRALRKIFQHYVTKVQLRISEEDVEKVVEACRGLEFTGSDIENLVDEINAHSIRRVFPNGEWCRMSPRELRRKLPDVRDIEFDRDIRPALRSLKLLDEEEDLDDSDSDSDDDNDDDEGDGNDDL